MAKKVMPVTANVVRAGKWWAVSVPEVDGLFTQVRRLDDVEPMVRDAAALLTGRDEDEFEVTVVVDSGRQADIERAGLLASRAEQSRMEAAAAARSVVSGLRADGLTVREVAYVMKISPQRVSQLAK